MSRKASRTNSSLEFLNARLDEVRMSNYERLRAKATLARTEAIADAAVRLINLVKRLLKPRAVRPARRPANSAG
jgi:hypothetical protein